MKLYLTSRALACRTAYPDLFACGDYIPLAAEGPHETAAGLTAAPSEPEATETAENATETTAAELTGNSPPVGSNLGGGDGGSLGLSGVLPFAAGAALMLCLVFVTLKRWGSTPR